MEKEIQLIQEQLTQHELRIQKLESALVSNVGNETYKTPTRKKLSLREFLHEVKPTSIVQKILAVGYYLEIHQGFHSFNLKDISHAFISAKEPPPSNIAAFINQNIYNRHIMQAEAKKDNLKAYVLTAPGEAFVDNCFAKSKS
jgi:hypothetical protein